MHCLAIKNKGKIYLVISNDGIFVSHIVFFECSLCVFSSFFYFCHGQWCNLMLCCMRLVKGNPVKVRSYTRSCMFCMSGNLLPLLRLRGGKASDGNEPENLPCPLCFIQGLG